MNYQECLDTKLRKGQRKLHTNIYLERDGDLFHVRYYDTDVLTFRPDGVVIVSHGGFITRSTADTINSFGPEGLNVRMSKGQFFVSFGDTKDKLWEKNDHPIRLEGGQIVCS